MSDKKITDNKKETAREIMLKQMVDQLTNALPALKEAIGDKKFEKRIRKAAKLLTEGIKNNEPEKEPKVKAIVPKKELVKPKVVAPTKKATKAIPTK